MSEKFTLCATEDCGHYRMTHARSNVNPLRPCDAPGCLCGRFVPTVSNVTSDIADLVGKIKQARSNPGEWVPVDDDPIDRHKDPTCATCSHGKNLHATEEQAKEYGLSFVGCTECPCVFFTVRQPINPEPGKNTRLQKWVDPAMFTSEKLDATQGPKVYLLAMNPDPLGSIAACAKMYKGEVVRDLADVTDEERRHYLAEMQKTKLTMPLEAVQLHFMIEGVTRSFTHQLVRQRTAAYAQESLRFAVIEEDFSSRVALPPSLAQLSPDHRLRQAWDRFVTGLGEAYNGLVNNGIPAEDARGLLPHNITTRVNYVTNLRGLLDHAGNRLCTQAQFEWRLVFARIAEEIRSRGGWYYANKPFGPTGKPPLHEKLSADWQNGAIAELLKPVCYQIGKCAFEAEFDRKCSIRDRVQANASINRPPSDWDSQYTHSGYQNPVYNPTDPTLKWPWAERIQDENGIRPGKPIIPAIHPAEWLLDPGAAR